MTKFTTKKKKKKKEVSQTEKQITYDKTYMWNLKSKTNWVNIRKQKQIQRHREQNSGYPWGEGKRERQDKGRGLKGKKYYV